MSATTINRAKVGQTEFTVHIQTCPDESGNFDEHGSATFDSEQDAREYGEVQLALHADAYASIRKGTWEADEFEDGEYGTVYDAEWVEDEKFWLDGWPKDGDTVWDGE